MSNHQTDNDPAQLSADRKPTYIKEQHNNNCQQFFGPISNCQFIMPAPAAQDAPQPKKAKPKPKPKHVATETTPPKTLKYYQHGNKGLLRKQRERVDMLYKLWVRLGWIDRNTDPDDFDAFFEGKPRHCNITWTDNCTKLFFMLKGLLLSDFIEKQSHCSATSMVKEQFLKTPNADSYRLNDEDVRNIKLSLLILDTSIPLPEPKGRGDDEEDTAEAGLLELLDNGMKITKGI